MGRHTNPVDRVFRIQFHNGAQVHVQARHHRAAAAIAKGKYPDLRVVRVAKA